jgi:Aminotransferase class-III
VVPDQGYLKQAQQLLHKHRALLIADEVQTGCARTGKMLACDHDPVSCLPLPHAAVQAVRTPLTGQQGPQGCACELVCPNITRVMNAWVVHVQLAVLLHALACDGRNRGAGAAGPAGAGQGAERRRVPGVRSAGRR